MLQELSIRNFAIIEDLIIRFEPGLTILSGETGAGKSIIINAVNLLLGNRASAALVRTGAESAELEALFDLPAGSPVAQAMAAAGYDPTEGLMVRRVISANERHRIYINGRLATMQALAELTARLASISGQHAHQGLLKEEEHLSILDHFGDLLALRARYAQAYAEILPLIRREQELLSQQSRQGEQMELLRFQGQEIAAAAPLAGEDEALDKERLRLKNGEALFQTVQQCVDGLYAADGAAYETLSTITKELARVSRLDECLVEKSKELEEVLFRVEDIAAHLRDYLKHLDLDPQRLDAVEARLDLLNKLKRKYGGTLERVLAHGEQIERRLNEIDHLDEHIAQARTELRRTHEVLCALAAELAERRRKVAVKLAAGVEKELAALKMAGTRFAVAVQPLPAVKESSPYLIWEGRALTEVGADRASFQIAPNVGEAIKPLAAIASGGELSRVVLALKAILARGDDLETVVFDEVDAGIGGGTAELVGKKLALLARRHQILCITHLPQIAKFGDHHLRIVKSVTQGRTRTIITPLDSQQRVEELARMLGGEKITDTTLAHAREMLAAK